MTATLLRAKLITLAATAAVAIAACGGAAATSNPGGAGATTVPAGATQPPAGGGATQQPGGGGPTVDACSFLTDDDIKSVTGYAVARKTPGAQVGMMQSGCEWELVAADEIVPPSIVLGIITTGGKEHYEKYFKPFIEAQGNTPLSGIGDEAVDAGFGVVQGVKGDAFFNLQYLGKDDHEVELAKKLVTHL